MDELKTHLNCDRDEREDHAAVVLSMAEIQARGQPRSISRMARKAGALKQQQQQQRSGRLVADCARCALYVAVLKLSIGGREGEAEALTGREGNAGIRQTPDWPQEVNVKLFFSTNDVNAIIQEKKKIVLSVFIGYRLRFVLNQT